MVRVGVTGCTGRMGRQLVQAVLEKAALAGGTVRPDCETVGQDLSNIIDIREASGHKIIADPGQLFLASDVVIDFTAPDATAHHSQLAQQTSTPLVIGTTGLSAHHHAAIASAAAHVPIVFDANFSTSITVLRTLVAQAAKALPACDIDVLEMHHRHKVDAPSGTALALGHAAAEARNQKLEDVQTLERSGHTGPRPAGEIGFATLRGGDVVGEHTVIYADDGERLELTSRITDRAIFARGAVRAAQWAVEQPPGLYAMTDVLGLSS